MDSRPTKSATKPERPRYTFGRKQKLKSRETIDTVYKTGHRRISHPLACHVVRREDNGLSRLGISIGRKVGNAVARNLIKRRIREAFRLLQHELPIGTDYLLVVRAHLALPMLDYQIKLRQLMR